MTAKEIMQILSDVGAIITGSHIVYTSGKHGGEYVNKDAVYPHTRKTSLLAWDMAGNFLDNDVDVVVGPAVGGVILSQWTAYHLSDMCGREILAVYAEKEIVTIMDPVGKDRKCYAETGKFIIKRGYGKLVKGKKVLVVEDVLTTGGSVKKVVEAVLDCGGEVVGVAVLCNRGKVGAEDIGFVPQLVSLISVDLNSWPEDECPLCKQGVPINTEVGKGRDFLAKKTGGKK